MEPYVLLATLACLTGCGKEERTEAIRLTRVLTQKQADFNQANTLEKNFVDSARAWCGSITANGAGRGAALDQNAKMATDLANSTVVISNHLSQVRQAVDGESLSQEYSQGVRAELITQLTKRQRQLQDMRALLEQSAPQFLEYRQSKAYAGDTYPAGISQLDTLLKSRKEPPDVLGAAVADLKAKYKLGPQDL